MEYQTVSAPDFGRSLRGVGLNLLCRDVGLMVSFLRDVLGLKVVRDTADFAIVLHDGAVFQLHADRTYGAHPVLSLLPETPPRGAGAQIYLFGLDPDACIGRADPAMVIEPARDKPHGLREATLLSPDGYAFSPAVPL